MESRGFCSKSYFDCFTFDGVGTWTIFFTKFLDQRRISMQASELKSLVNASKNSSEILQSISSDRFESLRVFTLPICEGLSLAERSNGKDVEIVQVVFITAFRKDFEMDMEIQKDLTFHQHCGFDCALCRSIWDSLGDLSRFNWYWNRG